MIITIDGPAATGKSSVTRVLAKKLDIHYLNSGLLFRALGYLLATKAGYTTKQFENIDKEDLQTYTDEKRLVYDYDEQSKPRILWDGEDITSHLKDSLVDDYASLVGMNARARNVLVDIQRKIAKNKSIIVEGRDSGSFVFPTAQYKFFLTATPAARAKRWQKDQAKLGNDYAIDLARELILERDRRDRVRPVGPLVVPQSAIIIDTSELTIEQTADEIMKIVKK